MNQPDMVYWCLLVGISIDTIVDGILIYNDSTVLDITGWW